MNVSGVDPQNQSRGARPGTGAGRDTPRVSRRLLLGVGGVLLLGGCADKIDPSAATGRNGGTGGTGGLHGTGGGTPDPTVPQPRKGAPFPGGDPAADTSTAPGDSHTNDTPPPDTNPPPANGGNDPAPPPGKPQFYVHEGDKAIALTIDDGPSGKYTPQVLALLAQYKIPATFCMIGGNAAKHASLVQEVTAAGHLVANHTYTHPDLSKMDAGAIRSEIERTTEALTKAGAKPPTFFRAPGGGWSPAVFDTCAKLGLRPLDWSVDPRDWARPGTDHIVSTVMGHTHTGSIILEHDGGGDRSQTVAALEKFLPQLLAAGYHFVQP